MRENNIRKAMKEVNIILEYIPNSEKDKINNKFLNFLNENEDKEHKFEFDLNKTLEEQNILDESKMLLTIICRDYWIDEKEKHELDKIMCENESKRIEKYDIDKIFKERKKEINNFETLQMIEYKENMFQKIAKYIQSMINKIMNSKLKIGNSIQLENGLEYIVVLKCKIKKLYYYLVSNISNQNENLVIQNTGDSVKIIKDNKLIKDILKEMLKTSM